MKVYHSISELVGHTPLVQLQRFARGARPEGKPAGQGRMRPTPRAA